MAEETDAALRARIRDMLRDGVKTQTGPVPETDEDAARIRSALQALPPDDWEGKVAMSGLADHPYEPEHRRCRECMYFLLHREWCNMPELMLPVEAEWHCLLWRI